MKKKGKGFAAAFYPIGLSGGGDPSQAMIQMQADGTAILTLGSVEIGQGSNTILAQIAAEELGLDYEQINVVSADKSNTLFCMGTFASRVTYIAGNAVIEAANEVKQILFDLAAKDLDAPPEALEAADGMIRVKEDPKRCKPIADITGEAGGGTLIVGRGAYMKVGAEDQPFCCYTACYAGAYAEVEVDTKTGVVDVQKLICVNDVGKAINPALAEGQIEGGAGMGFGSAIMEARNPSYPKIDHVPASLVEYLIPTTVDMPDLEIEQIEIASDGGPYGARAIGEMSSNCQAPAIINAIHDAVDVFITSLPATPEKVLRALVGKNDI
jgi:CO/xanthine dehydrogenase Mo-binding subunit